MTLALEVADNSAPTTNAQVENTPDIANTMMLMFQRQVDGQKEERKLQIDMQKQQIQLQIQQTELQKEERKLQMELQRQQLEDQKRGTTATV